MKSRPTSSMWRWYWGPNWGRWSPSPGKDSLMTPKSVLKKFNKTKKCSSWWGKRQPSKNWKTLKRKWLNFWSMLIEGKRVIKLRKWGITSIITLISNKRWWNTSRLSNLTQIMRLFWVILGLFTWRWRDMKNVSSTVIR